MNAITLRRGIIILVAVVSLPFLILYFSVGLRSGGWVFGVGKTGCHYVKGPIDYGFLLSKAAALFFVALVAYIKLRQRS